MRQDYEKLFSRLESVEPPKGLFDRIILAIRRERELKQRRGLLFEFVFLLVISLVATPFSLMVLINQAASSGISYYISAAASDLGTFFALWQDFGLAILESLPIAGLAAFVLSVGVALFTLRLFLRKKRFLVSYLLHSF
jgi:hypothetical protein